MLTKDDIIFEEDLLAHAHIHSQDEVKDALISLISTFVVELHIKRLEKVIIKKTDFFDTKLGIANYKKYTIVLANNIAYCLADPNARFYKRSLAVLKHELYHFQDFQNLLFNCALNRIPTLTKELLDKFEWWTEFHASFSTYEICEDEDLYRSFESVFSKSYSSIDERKYYACRLLGYYFHNDHTAQCDNLVDKYLSCDKLDQARNSFESLLKSHPYITEEQLKVVDSAIQNIITKEDTKPKYTPISNEDWLKRYFRAKQNDKKDK